MTEQEKKLLLSMERFRKDNPYLFFTPCFKGEEFIKLFGEPKDDKFIYFFIGGNGSGKSVVLANIIANICCEPKNKYFDFGIFKAWPYLKKIRIISDPTTVSEKTVPELLKWLPRGKYKAGKEKKSYFSKFFFPETGFSLDLMTYEQDPKEFESVDLGLCLSDEPCPEDIFNASLSRLRVGEGGIFGSFFTPLASAAYLFDRFIDNPSQQYADWRYISVFDNLEGQESRGFLKRETVERMIANYTEEEKEARIKGSFMHLGGLIFKEFDRQKHIVKMTLPELISNIPRRHWRVAYAIDPHPVENTAVLFMALLPDGRRVFIDEIWLGADCGIIAQKINNILDYCERLGADTMKRVGLIDPSAVIKDKLRGDRSWKDDLFKVGIKTIEATKDRDRADDCIRQELRGTVNPNIYILNNCCRTIWEFARYQKDPNNPTKRLDRDDHFVENAGRLLLAFPHYLFKKTSEEKRRRIIQGIN